MRMNRHWTTRVVVPALAASMLALSLAGCVSIRLPGIPSSSHTASSGGDSSPNSQHVALEKYAAAERSTIPKITEKYPGLYSDITIVAQDPAEIVYTYTFAKYVDPAKAASYFDTAEAALKSVCDTSVFPAMEKAGVSGPESANYVYINSDGTTLWSKVFTSS